MYVEIKNNQLLSWCDFPYLDYEFVDIDYSTFDLNKYEVVDGVLTDISKTQEYKNKITQAENQATKINLQSQIDEIDKKRVRAICEPQIKDESTGETWLDFYTEQVQALREELINLT